MQFLDESATHYDTGAGEHYSSMGESSHGEAVHECEHSQLFTAGAVYESSTGVFYMMVVIVVAFVLIVDFTFHVLHFFTHESPFNKMINAIEKELMTVGFTAFIFKIIANASTFFHEHKDWEHAFELADLLVPVFSFCNCFLGLILVFLSIRQCNKWSKASNLDLSELLDRFYDDKRHWMTNLLPNMFNTDVGKMEFRIFHNIFCEMYGLKRDAFAFDEYVNNVFEKFVFTIVKIRPINWICLCLLLFLDHARTSNEFYVTNCEKEDIECIDESSIKSFAVIGSIIFGITCCFYVAAHYYESRIIIEKGINGYDYYPTYLQFMEDEQCIQGERLNEEELKEAAVEMRRAYMMHQHHKSHRLISMKKDKSVRKAMAVHLEKRHSKTDFIEQLNTDQVMEFMNERLKSKNSFVTGEIDDAESQSDRDKINAFCPPELLDMGSGSGSIKPIVVNLNELSDSETSDEGKVERRQSKKNGISAKSKSSSQASMHLQAVSTLSREIDDEDDEVLQGSASKSPASKTPPSRPTSVVRPASRTESDAEIRNNSMTRMSSDEMRSPSHKSILNQFHSTSTQLTADNNIVLGMFKSRQTKHERIKDIFLFSSPTFFFECVKIMIMLISLNFAFWLIYFIGSRYDITPAYMKFYSIAPPILTFIVYLDVVKTASLLKAVVTLDTDAMVQVIELSEEAERLEGEVRKEIVETLFEDEELEGLSLEQKLKKVYERIDADGNGHMTRVEFTEFLHTLEIYPSRKALRQIFRKMDRNVDNDISLAEFTLFIMPDNNKANIEEEKRLEEVRIRVTAKTIELAEVMKQRQQNPTVWDRILGRNHHHHPLSGAAGGGGGDSSKHASVGGGDSSKKHGGGTATTTPGVGGEYEMVNQAEGGSNRETKSDDHIV